MIDFPIAWTERKIFQPDLEFKKELANETDAVWEGLMPSKFASYYRIPEFGYVRY